MNLWRPPAFSMTSTPGPQIKMVGISENQLRSEFLQIFRDQRFDGALSPHGSEDRRIDHAMSGVEFSQARALRVEESRFKISKVFIGSASHPRKNRSDSLPGWLVRRRARKAETAVPFRPAH